MNNEQLWHLIEEVKKITKHDSFVVIGSLSILGYAERNQVEVPYAMCCSMDLDFYQNFFFYNTDGAWLVFFFRKQS